MQTSVKKVFIFFLFSFIFVASAIGQSPAEKEVAAEVEKLSALLINPDKAKLQDIAADALSYGHSSGKIETKEQFIEALVSGQTDFTDVAVSDQEIKIVENTAVVRHKLLAKLVDPGKGTTTVNLAIILVYAKQKGKWKLLARQASKIQA